ncbi:hypothetical protein C8R43DRAFT_999481 [Mycena crocata]|nr:hypothetical protein C8R43DRAFT_999481 [Mycena crocata]
MALLRYGATNRVLTAGSQPTPCFTTHDSPGFLMNGRLEPCLKTYAANRRRPLSRFAMFFSSLLPALLLAVSSILAAVPPPDDARLIQFSDSHLEWINTDALDFLLELRHEEAIVSAEALKASEHAALLEGISDSAIETLVHQAGFAIGYRDVTEIDRPASLQAEAVVVPAYPTPSAAAHPEVTDLFAKISQAELRGIIGNLSTNFKTRYYRSSVARQSSLWIQTKLASMPGVNVTLFENTFDQPNVIGRLEGDGTSSQVILLGGHLDSTSQSATTLAPGADDDASGTAVAMHALNILANAGYKGKYPIEVHAYAGEEGGLLGSAKLAQSYKNKGVVLRGMLNLEMVGWSPATSSNTNKSSTITVLTDPTPGMGTHMTKVIAEYIPTAERRAVACGYGCSDHYSWSELDYPVVCIATYGPNDASLNPAYHTTGDTIDKLNFNKMTDFVKATLAWIVEVSSA